MESRGNNRLKGLIKEPHQVGFLLEPDVVLMQPHFIGPRSLSFLVRGLGGLEEVSEVLEARGTLRLQEFQGLRVPMALAVGLRWVAGFLSLQHQATST